MLILDLDGTLRETKSGKRFINTPDDQKAIPGAFDAINYSVHRDCIGCTNQLGVGAGYKTLENCIEEQRCTLEIFPQLDLILFCPDRGKTCWAVDEDDEWEIWKDYKFLEGKFRKPQPGMLILALHLTQSVAAESLFVGDRTEDEQAALFAGIQFQWAKEFRATGLRGATAHGD